MSQLLVRLWTFASVVWVQTAELLIPLKHSGATRLSELRLVVTNVAWVLRDHQVLLRVLSSKHRTAILPYAVVAGSIDESITRRRTLTIALVVVLNWCGKYSEVQPSPGRWGLALLLCHNVADVMVFLCLLRRPSHLVPRQLVRLDARVTRIVGRLVPTATIRAFGPRQVASPVCKLTFGQMYFARLRRILHSKVSTRDPGSCLFDATANGCLLLLELFQLVHRRERLFIRSELSTHLDR